MYRINSKQSYLDNLPNNNGSDKRDPLSEALKYALDIRKFEIDLYWRRAAYFWTLIAASFAGYFSLQNVEENKRDLTSIFMICCIGMVLSFAWYLVNRGSKYWQENWERHVDVLAEDVIGPLYRTTLAWETKTVVMPHKGFPFSVSRINQMVSLYVTILWMGLSIQTFLALHPMDLPIVSTSWLLAGYTIVFLLLISWLGWPRKIASARPVLFDMAELEDEKPDASSSMKTGDSTASS